MEADINTKNLKVLRFFFHVVLVLNHLRHLLNCIMYWSTGQQEFCSSLLDGTLPPHHKSEPVPQEVSFFFFCFLNSLSACTCTEFPKHSNLETITSYNVQHCSLLFLKYVVQDFAVTIYSWHSKKLA